LVQLAKHSSLLFLKKINHGKSQYLVILIFYRTDSVKQLIWSWTANIYNKIDAYRMQNPAKEPQLAGGELMAGMANQAAGH
jgi:hypothetical protein